MKLGIFGGCFNPPHNMHKDIALQLIDKGYLDKVIYVPTSTSYKKDGIIDFEDRYNMLNIIVDGLNNIEVSRIGSESYGEYTYQVLDYFHKMNPNDELYFICGIDNLYDFDNWKNYEYILENYKFLVIDRDGFDKLSLWKKYEKYTDNLVLAEIDPVKLASTSIRSLIKMRQYTEIEKFLDKKVYEYLIRKKLYR